MKRMLLIGALLLTGCVTKLGEFTIYCPEAIDLSKGEYTVDRTKKVKGVDPASIYLVYATNAPQYDEAVRKAMAKMPKCVGLADVTVKRRAFWLLFGFCDFEAEGYPIVKKEVQ